MLRCQWMHIVHENQSVGDYIRREILKIRQRLLMGMGGIDVQDVDGRSMCGPFGCQLIRLFHMRNNQWLISQKRLDGIGIDVAGVQMTIPFPGRPTILKDPDESQGADSRASPQLQDSSRQNAACQSEKEVVIRNLVIILGAVEPPQIT